MWVSQIFFRSCRLVGSPTFLLVPDEKNEWRVFFAFYQPSSRVAALNELVLGYICVSVSVCLAGRCGNGVSAASAATQRSRAVDSRHATYAQRARLQEPRSAAAADR